MRAAPVGLFVVAIGGSLTSDETFELGVEIAAITHGQSTGSLTAGVVAVMVAELVRGRRIADALTIAFAVVRARPHAHETVDALTNARRLAAEDVPVHEAIARLGQGWVAEEALAIAAYCALTAEDLASAVLAAVNHDGDSDSTGAITGNLLGALWGVEAIPSGWLEELELRDVIAAVADDLHEHGDWQIDEYGPSPDLERVWGRYPGF